MKLSSAVKAFGSLCLLLVDGFPVSEYKSPKIIGPHHVKIKANPGQQLSLHCKAFTNCDADEALIYWLVNDTFPEDTHSSGRIVESDESTSAGGAIVQRSLELKKVETEDLTSTFTCVVLNSAGVSRKNITLAATGCNARKKRKHRISLQ